MEKEVVNSCIVQKGVSSVVYDGIVHVISRERRDSLCFEKMRRVYARLC